MKKYFVAVFVFLATVLNSLAAGWPAGFEGVMLQGFYWDSYRSETKWTKLEARADELSPFFKLIWVPNSAKSSGGLGYMPIYWFTNHNSAMGTEDQLRSMIAAYKQRGTGIIADVVLNHRTGKSNWYNFPKETWNGQTWQIGLDGICKDDEINNPGNPGGATGAYDEGEGFNAARDLDHSNANVQNNAKNYCKCLLDEYGYEGFRLDMTKGYPGKYTKMYNQYAKPKYSVGEFWDGSYDELAKWIEATGRESAAFDFAFKYAVNQAFEANDMSKLVWLENGVTPRPAGLIHHEYQQYAVTFIDNHDTYEDEKNVFHGNVLAANAFMICSPGTPCVFLPHWNAHAKEIGAMIRARNACGVTNTSDVKVLKYTRDCYMAEISGKKAKLVVRVGSSSEKPSGYNDSQIFCKGTDYCIWTTTGKTDTDYDYPDQDNTPAKLYLMGNLKQGSWMTNVAVNMTKKGDKFVAQGVELVAAGVGYNAYFSFVTGLAKSADDWDTVNGNDRYGAESKDKPIKTDVADRLVAFKAGDNAPGAFSWEIVPGIYDFTVDFSAMTVLVSQKTEGVSTTVTDDVVPIYYNLQGRRVDNPGEGLYIVVRGDKVTKEIVR